MKPSASLLILCVCVIVVCLPRLNRQDLGIDAFTTGGKPAAEVVADAGEYVRLVQYFRHGNADLIPDAPFSHRPLVPLVAARLPLQPMTAINVLNLAAMMAALLILYRILSHLDCPVSLRLLGCALFVFSFPTFYYGPIGIVDPVLICFLMAGALCTLKDRWLPLLLLLIVGASVKETIVVLIPVLAARYLVKREAPRTRQAAVLVLLCVGAFGTLWVLRHWTAGQGYTWEPSLRRWHLNASRPRSWVSFVLSFGVPGFLAVGLLFVRGRVGQCVSRVDLVTLWAGLAMSVVLFGYAMVSAYADGRFAWTGYPYSIPLAMVFLACLKDRRVEPQMNADGRRWPRMGRRGRTIRERTEDRKGRGPRSA